MVSLSAEEKLAQAVLSLQRELDLPIVEPVARPALHVTVQGVDFVEKLTPEQVAAMAAKGRKVLSGFAPFTLDIRNANSFSVAAFFEAHDGGAVREIRARLREAMPWLAEGGRDPFVRDGVDHFLPHVSVAYYRADSPNTQVVKALRRRRRLEVTKVVVTEVRLARVPPPGTPDRWRWPAEAVFGLGQGPSG
jgi:2'-5' RNA ligase